MQKVIITWVSSWLGLVLAKTFIDKGYEVVGLSRTKPELSITHIPTDFTSKDSILQSAKEISQEHKWFSAIICCAGIAYIEKMEHIDYDHTQEMISVNLTWQAYLLGQIAWDIKSNGSDLVFIWASIAFKANEHMPIYSITKRGLRWLVENRRDELKNTPSRVMVIHPWGLNTQSNIWPQGRGTIISTITGKPLGTAIDTQVIADIALSLFQLPKTVEVSEVMVNRK